MFLMPGFFARASSFRSAAWCPPCSLETRTARDLDLFGGHHRGRARSACGADLVHHAGYDPAAIWQGRFPFQVLQLRAAGPWCGSWPVRPLLRAGRSPRRSGASPSPGAGGASFGGFWASCWCSPSRMWGTWHPVPPRSGRNPGRRQPRHPVRGGGDGSPGRIPGRPAFAAHFATPTASRCPRAPF